MMQFTVLNTIEFRYILVADAVYSRLVERNKLFYFNAVQYPILFSHCLRVIIVLSPVLCSVFRLTSDLDSADSRYDWSTIILHFTPSLIIQQGFSGVFFDACLVGLFWPRDSMLASRVGQLWP